MIRFRKHEREDIQLYMEHARLDLLQAGWTEAAQELPYPDYGYRYTFAHPSHKGAAYSLRQAITKHHQARAREIGQGSCMPIPLTPA